jgi:hypothetical protein
MGRASGCANGFTRKAAALRRLRPKGAEQSKRSVRAARVLFFRGSPPQGGARRVGRGARTSVVCEVSAWKSWGWVGAARGPVFVKVHCRARPTVRPRPHRPDDFDVLRSESGERPHAAFACREVWPLQEQDSMN